ncbi:MAG: hypothetical protein K8H88_09675, partial [Sandaracinaceae bacterium]|nr:hypothetical protein [Sandaracinaceae bacterium]
MHGVGAALDAPRDRRAQIGLGQLAREEGLDGGRGKEIAYDVPAARSEMLTDAPSIQALFAGDLTETDLRAAIAWCVKRCPD